MFKITKNDLLAAKRITYEDHNGNSLLVKLNQTMNEVILKLRFADKTLNAEAVTINIPVSKDFKGVSINLNRSVNDGEIDDILENFANIGNRWMEIPYLLTAFSNTDKRSKHYEKIIVSNMLKKENPNLTEEELENLSDEIATTLLIDEMKNFEELEPLIKLFVVEEEFE